MTKKFQMTQNDKILNMKNWDQLKMKSNKRLKNINTHTAGSISGVFRSCTIMKAVKVMQILIFQQYLGTQLIGSVQSSDSVLNLLTDAALSVVLYRFM